MSVNPLIKVIFDALGAALYFWLAWQSLRTGLPAGNPRLFSRSERPLQFWSFVAFMLAAGLWYGSKAVGLLDA